LHAMFGRVPATYDLCNRLLTLRLDERWRRQAAAVCLEGRPARVLDLGTGTGDLALWLRRLAPAGAPASIVGLDYSLPMLQAARQKAQRRGAADRGVGPRWVLADAAAVPFPDGLFDAVGIGFAFRNLTFQNPGRDRFLAEIRRVLRPGGRLVIVETSQPAPRPVRWLVHAYYARVVGPVGGLVSGQRAAYRYLAHSAAHYLDAAGVAALLQAAGFAAVRCQPRWLGVATLYTAVR